MSQDDTPDLATPQAGKVAPESVTLRVQPRPVTRLNRRTLAILVGGLSVAVLGATIWSLQPQRHGANEQTELYNIDRVSKSERLDGLPVCHVQRRVGNHVRGNVSRKEQVKTVRDHDDDHHQRDSEGFSHEVGGVDHGPHIHSLIGHLRSLTGLLRESLL